MDDWSHSEPLRLAGLECPASSTEMDDVASLRTMGFAADLAERLVSQDEDPPLRVLDLGCGNGVGAIFFARTDPRARSIGVDFFAKFLKEAKRRSERCGVGDQVTWVRADLRHSIPVSSNWPSLLLVSAVGNLFGDFEQTLLRLQGASGEGCKLLWLETRYWPAGEVDDGLSRHLHRQAQAIDNSCWHVGRRLSQEEKSFTVQAGGALRSYSSRTIGLYLNRAADSSSSCSVYDDAG